jgi:hypothetical protein
MRPDAVRTRRRRIREHDPFDPARLALLSRVSQIPHGRIGLEKSRLAVWLRSNMK